MRAEGVALLGEERVRQQRPRCGADDFSVFASLAPGCYFLPGVGDGRETFYECHDPRFDIDESAPAIGSAMPAGTALRLLRALRQGPA